MDVAGLKCNVRSFHGAVDAPTAFAGRKRPVVLGSSVSADPCRWADFPVPACSSVAARIETLSGNINLCRRRIGLFSHNCRDAAHTQRSAPLGFVTRFSAQSWFAE